MCLKTNKVTISHEKQAETEIEKLLDQDFIELVNSSPEWVSPLFCVPKKNEMSACV